MLELLRGPNLPYFILPFLWLFCVCAGLIATHISEASSDGRADNPWLYWRIFGSHLLVRSAPRYCCPVRQDSSQSRFGLDWRCSLHPRTARRHTPGDPRRPCFNEQSDSENGHWHLTQRPECEPEEYNA